ncbi:exo-beta-N-acetylmuramidase NamZ family protein [Aestuariibaculum sediminum]|uniref:DUF1343 domain-containing protein n=1 Tax=Aestuariibaculum sediminum TaxID=2770637 RepID=A0A8J6QL90_9FLAO|nr:DUF1343 domain-containing protein [Aestuariibaculum sediminum]MBD0833319.1 DUF1343 domain-containing protein [Aestuariibaculum sediminum]
MKYLSFILILFVISCKSSVESDIKWNEIDNNLQLNDSSLVVGANQIQRYLPLLKGKRVGVVANQTSVVFKENNNFTHLVDSLLALKIEITKVYAPEHGFRGTADAGEHIEDGIDAKTGLPVISLYGENRKPSAEHLEGIEVMLFDIQDVGVRFYTYLSTLHYIMEACAELNIPVIVLDRPNPNGHYVDGPVLEEDVKSFVGMHPVPIVYGMTIGEYGKMINGEQWLKDSVRCNLTVVPLKHYTHKLQYDLPIKPSPNLFNAKSINLYPSLCFFEGTNVSCGRGTEMQFQVFGSPFLSQDKFDYSFTPRPNFGAKNPKYNGVLCYGSDLSSSSDLNKIELKWVIDAYNSTKDPTVFFNKFFPKLAGNKTLQNQIEQGIPVEDIVASWQSDLKTFKIIRARYLLYE